MLTYTLHDCIIFLFFYSFLGWCMEVVIASIKTRHFINKGFLNLPITLPYGISAVILLQILPSLQQHLSLQWIATLFVFHFIWMSSEVFIQNICHLKEEDTSNLPTLTRYKQLIFELCASSMLLAVLLIVHPFLYSLIKMIPTIIISIISFILSIILILDFICVLSSLKSHQPDKISKRTQKSTQNLVDSITSATWNRLQKSYPDLSVSTAHSFGHGLCFDKLVWIFLISSFLGALIEMCFCRIMDGYWMNRSSLVYGPFSIVWGIGAVVLTISLKPLSKRHNLILFSAGFFIGGVYEYCCSLFTEIVFGTVFWDYSEMVLNIGGRTNVLYCIFWGLLGVVWVRQMMPPLEKTIEKIPPLTGKITTWFLVLIFLFDGLLTSFAMMRYTARQQAIPSGNVLEEFIDHTYDDAWMQMRWPNMTFTKEKGI